MISDAKQILIGVLKGSNASRALDRLKLSLTDDDTKYWYFSNSHDYSAIYVCNKHYKGYNDIYGGNGYITFTNEPCLIMDLAEINQSKTDLIELPVSLIKDIIEVSNFI